MSYSEDDMLMLSGIQHFKFCPRQWALIHIDQLWEENRLTYDGRLLHSNVDNPFYRKKIGNVLTLRSVNIASRQLGLYGVSDIIELYPSPRDEGFTHPDYPGFWEAFPIEYKRGKPKPDYIDEVQLAAQAICIEELYATRIEKGAIFYGETQHRHEVIFTDELRKVVADCAFEMHALFKAQTLPPPPKNKRCSNCSLKDQCHPNLSKRLDPNEYIRLNLYEETS